MLAFCHGNKIPEIIIIKGEIWEGSGDIGHFRGFSPGFPGPVAFGPVVKQNIMAGNTWRKRPGYLLAARKQKNGRQYPFKDMPPVT